MAESGNRNKNILDSDIPKKQILKRTSEVRSKILRNELIWKQQTKPD